MFNKPGQEHHQANYSQEACIDPGAFYDLQLGKTRHEFQLQPAAAARPFKRRGADPQNFCKGECYKSEIRAFQSVAKRQSADKSTHCRASGNTASKSEPGIDTIFDLQNSRGISAGAIKRRVAK